MKRNIVNLFKDPILMDDNSKIYYLKKNIILKMECPTYHCIKVNNAYGGFSLGIDPLSTEDVIRINEEYENLYNHFSVQDVFKFQPIFMDSTTMKFFRIDGLSTLWSDEDNTYPWELCPKHFTGSVSLKIRGVIVKAGVGYCMLHIDQVLIERKENEIKCLFKKF